jgi:hypothetical protein
MKKEMKITIDANGKPRNEKGQYVKSKEAIEYFKSEGYLYAKGAKEAIKIDPIYIYGKKPKLDVLIRNIQFEKLTQVEGKSLNFKNDKNGNEIV